MNTDLSVPDLKSKAKGIFVICFLLFDIVFAVFQMLPFMGVAYFFLCYVVWYVFVFVLYCIVSFRNPGYQPIESGKDLLKKLAGTCNQMGYKSYSSMKLKTLHAKYCYHCNVRKSKTSIFH